jgi:hypothetical protein
MAETEPRQPRVVITAVSDPEREISFLRWLIDAALKHQADRAREEAAATKGGASNATVD